MCLDGAWAWQAIIDGAPGNTVNVHGPMVVTGRLENPDSRTVDWSGGWELGLDNGRKQS